MSSVLGLGVAGLAASAPVSATPTDEAPEVPPGVEAQIVPQAEQADAAEYWTEERMAAAQPIQPEIHQDIAPETLDQFLDDLNMNQGDPRTVAPDNIGPQDPAQTPHVGKVFFSTPEGDFVCSGNIVASANQSTVSTAGHCLHDGAGGQFADNFAFAPAYDYGESEFGVWSAVEMAAPDDWVNDSSFDDDVAFAQVETRDGVTIEEAVGAASAIAFNQPRNQPYTAYGYPATLPFNGEELHLCEGTATDDPMGGSTQGIPCDMTGGSSGGPWFLSGGAQNSVNSYMYTFLPGVMFGPYFGDNAEEVYDYVSTR